jgi:outer membrane receptor protein involved in Fe transport
MPRNSSLSCAIMAILASHGVTAAAADKTSAASGQIEEVVVTATRRSESLQDVPIAIQALTGETLDHLNIQTFEQYLRFLPNVTAAGQGPGQNQIYMRGLAAVTDANQVSGGTGPFPNVAVYLDDQSVQLPGRNLDVYAADLERIEVLEGPQGTLYGAGAQAGAIRYITNKPRFNDFDFGVKAAYETTSHGDPSNKVEAWVNIPIIDDKLAARLVVYNDERGGYIHNVRSTFQRTADGSGIQYYFGGVLPEGVNTLSNDRLVDDAYNPVKYQGARISGVYQFNDDWKLSVQHSYQKLRADGVFGFDPELGDLKMAQYNQTRLDDKFNNTAWTVNGRLAALDVVYTGGYLVRKLDGVTDYTSYANSFYGPYYQCAGGPYFSNPAGPETAPYCGSPSAVWRDIQENRHQSHEIRVSTPSDKRLRAIGGIFYEDFKIEDSANFIFGNGDAGFFGQKPVPGTTQFDPRRRPDGNAFFNDITRGYKQQAVFGEVSYDILPERLTFTAGIRFYNMDTYEKGSANSGYGCRWVVDCTEAPFSKNLDALKLQKDFSGNTTKFNLTWKVTDAAMVYATYSEGFRPGGFNRGQGIVPDTSPIKGRWEVPLFFDSDDLVNKEIGWKTTWLDGRLLFNGAIYQEDWKRVLITQFDPSIYGNLVFTSNGPDYRVRGTEEEIVFKATEGLTLWASASWNSSEQMNQPIVLGNDGQPVDLYLTAGKGSRLAQSPPFQGNVRARYEFDVRGFNAYVQAAAQHTAHSKASVIKPFDYNQKAYSTWDAAMGFTHAQWGVELYGENLSDTRAELYINPDNGPLVTVTNRPRTIGLRVSYSMGGQ